MSLEWLSNLSACAKGKAKKHRVSHPLAQHQRWTKKITSCKSATWKKQLHANCINLSTIPTSYEADYDLLLTSNENQWQELAQLPAFLGGSLDHGGLQHSALISGGCTSHSPATGGPLFFVPGDLQADSLRIR